MSVVFYRRLFLTFLALATFGFLAEISGHGIGAGILHLDKVAHFSIFMVLAWLTWKGFKPHFWVVLILLSGYGALVEVVQHYFTRRSGDWLDWLADTAGILTFYALRTLWHKWRPRNNR
ncbi:VanZ family protein [Chromatiaceae bacterium AAb-1]|nr:VanZ family protein [Chromatiaceae bacterium AAb-1]